MKKMNVCRSMLTAIAIGSIAFAAAPAVAQDSIEKFAEFDASNATVVDYGPIDEFYEALTVKERARRKFRYSAIRQGGEEILQAYISFMEGLTPTRYSRNEQLAYWLNLRNLLVVHAIAMENPGRSIKGERGDFETPGSMWTKTRVTVEDVAMSIDDIERNIILANWASSPDVLYGLYQGAEGGPAFNPPKNFTGGAIQNELSERASAFVNGRRVVRVRRGAVEAPAIYGWYKGVLFNGDDASVIDHLKQHADNGLKRKLEDAGSVAYKSMEYAVEELEVRQQREFNNQPSGGFTGGSGS